MEYPRFSREESLRSGQIRSSHYQLLGSLNPDACLRCGRAFGERGLPGDICILITRTAPEMSDHEMDTNLILKDLRRIVRTSEELLHATKDAVGDTTKEVRERLVETLESAKRTCHRLEGEVLKGAKAADRVVREHPYESLGVALGVGLLIGILVTRK